MLITLSVLLQKYYNSKVSMGISININIITTIIFRLIIAVIPNRVILQGGINNWYILFVGIVFRFLGLNTAFNYYKIIPSSPILIIPVIIVIEFIRYIIRPLSLILRIIINLTIGHIVMYLLSFPISIVYNLIEIFIYSIQIYIFWTLISIYRK